jgi:adenylate kinase family enzyme
MPHVTTERTIGPLFRRQYDTLAITGVPGTGKTTLATILSERLGWPILSTGNIARVIDPGGLSRGDMAEETGFALAFGLTYQKMLSLYPKAPVILDGIPRTVGQLEYLQPYSTRVLLLTARMDVAVDRLRRRGREDDTPELIERRIRQQGALLEIDNAKGWAFQIAGFHTSVNTTYKTPDVVAEGVIQYLLGNRTEAF